MRIVNAKEVARTVQNMRTISEFGSAVGNAPTLLNEIFHLPGYENLTLMRLTQNLAGLMKKELGEGDIRNIETLRLDWRLDAGPRIPETVISEDNTFNFEGNADGSITVKEKIFSRGDVFEFVDTGHQFRVQQTPETLATDKHEMRCMLLGSRRDRALPSGVNVIGKRVRFIMGGVVPEASEYGSYFQLPNRMERHTNFMTRFRVDGSQSGDFAYGESIYLQRIKKNLQNEVIGTGDFYRQDAAKKAMMDKLMLSINSGLLFSQGGFDDKLIHMCRELDGREIPIGQGVIPQVRAYGQFMAYNSAITESILQEIINVIVDRRPKKTGNDLVFLVNWRLFQQVNKALDLLTRTRLTTQESYLKKDNGSSAYIVGITYKGYEFSGNKIFVMEDSTLTDRYPDRGYGICFNTRVQTKDGGEAMNIQQFTIKGFEMFDNELLGVGGRTGHSSGPVSSVVHANADVMMAYRGVAVYDPYSTMILEEN